LLKGADADADKVAGGFFAGTGDHGFGNPVDQFLPELGAVESSPSTPYLESSFF